RRSWGTLLWYPEQCFWCIGRHSRLSSVGNSFVLQQQEAPMPKYLSVILVAALSSTALCGIAQQTAPKIKNVPIQPTSAVSGEQMYATYCAVCHGTDGR